MSDTTITPRSRLGQYTRDFWLINGIELLERGAYYSMSAVLTVFMVVTLKIPAATAGLIGAFLFALLYFVPLFAAPMAEKFGYKQALFVVFTLLAGGYAAMGFAADTSGVLLAVVLIGLGAGIFKPIAAAMVAQSTTMEQRNAAFSIYYACINLGALIFPLGVGLVGIFSPDLLYTVAFGVGAALGVANLGIVLLAFRNLREPQREKNVLQAYKALGEVFKDGKFLVLLVIYSGFWFMYAMSLTFITAYMVEFGRAPGWFNVALQQAVNPAVIILAAPLLAAPFLAPLMKRVHNLTLMVVGISLYVIGFVVVGFTGSFVLFLAGILLFSVGELLTHPSYLSYVTKISPPDRVSVYLGYGFIPVGMGLFFGASIGGSLYGSIAQQGNPQLFWAIMAAVGLVTIAALLVYNRAIAPKPAPIAPGPERAPEPRASRRVVAGSTALALLAILLVPALVAAAMFSGGTQPLTTNGDGAPLSPINADLGTVKLADSTQTVACAKESVEIVSLPANATGIALFTLTWKTPAASSPVGATTPDTYELHVTPPSGAMNMTQPSNKGSVEVTLPAMGGDYTVTTKLAKCGGETIATPLGPAPAGSSTRTQGTSTLGGSYQSPK